MDQSPHSDPGSSDNIFYRSLHDERDIDPDAWLDQWYGGFFGLDPDHQLCQDAESALAAQFGLHPAVREVDAEDLGHWVGLLRMIGAQNPYDAYSNSAVEQQHHHTWEQQYQVARRLGRQIVRSTLEDAEDYADFRMEQERAGTDYLTGVANRRGLARRLHDTHGITTDPVRRTESGEPLPPAKIASIYCDANRFRWINNTLGHSVGDAAIIETAWEIQDFFRQSEVLAVYRHGGDEFGILLDDLTEQDVDALTDRIIRRQIEKAMGDRYRQAMTSITERILAVKASGRRPRIEAHKQKITQAESRQGTRPYHTIYISGTAVAELRDIITLALGARSGMVSNLEDIEELRRAAEEAMSGAKRVFGGILGDTDNTLHRAGLDEPRA